MKKKFSKILGIGLTLALITSLLLTAAPVMAATAITGLTVTVSDLTISKAADYTITFDATNEVTQTADGSPYDIIIAFPLGTAVPASAAWVYDANTTLTDVTVQSTAGFGTAHAEISLPTSSITTTAATSTAGPIVNLDLNVLGDIGEAAMVRVKFKNTVVTNPASVGSYTLAVSTSADTTAVASPSYTTAVPDIGVLPGIVQQFNSTGVLMDQATGDTAIIAMVDTAGEDYTIIVGPGEYAIAAVIALDQAGLILKSSAGADDTTIVAAATADAIQITADEVTVDGFTIEDTLDTYTAIKVTGDDATVINNVMTDTEELGYPEGISIEGSAAGATVTGNELDIYHTMMVQVAASDLTLSGNTFGAGINLHNTPSDITITGNDITGSELWGIVLWTGGTYTDVLIEDNTISETTEGDAIGICVQGTAIATNLQIVGNDITDNEGVGIQIESAATLNDSVIKFNTITGNDADNDGYGIQNDTTVDVDATFNWWGTDVAADVADMVSIDVIYEPFLADAVATVLSASDTAAGATSLDAKTTVGVRVSITNAAKTAIPATTISVAKYVANPQAAISDAIAFFDVYVVGTGAAATDLVTIKFYAGDENTEVWIWSTDTESWAEVEADFSVYGGYVYVIVTADVLDGTPFALVAGEAEADVIDPPVIATPVSGDDTVSLTPLFAWSAIPDAVGYDFQFADNANFVAPLVHLVGDNRLIVTAYAYVHELPYSTAYYWRVKAVSATAESAWVSGVFITKDEPVEPTPPVVIEETEPPVIIIEQPDIIVPLPAETPITPSWIYVIIGVGAVLVIALLVLIVRTRRVA